MIERPTISVVIPLPDDRGHALDCLTAFARQTLNVGFEIIVATDAESAEEIAWLVDHFPQVRWLYEPGLRMNALYNVGAAVASGKYLYISESHCIPRSDCLQKIYDFVQESDLAVACSSSDGINGNHIARCEQRLFEEDFHRWMSAGKRKVAIRGTLIERKLWERIGGFRDEFGHFSELLIGRQMEAAGVQVGHAEKSWVSHGNQVSLEPLWEELIEYGEDEFRSCDFLPAEQRIANSREWTEREWLRDNPTWLSFRQSKEAVRQWFRAFAINYIPMSEEWRYRLFRRYWKGAVRQGRLNYLASISSHLQVNEEVTTSPVVYQKAA